jgi:glycosyltransferase involved in cell wall biosynthesis
MPVAPPQSPLVSLVTPVFNGAAGIEANVREIVAALESLSTDFEVIVVCDGSTDGSAAAARRVEDPRVHVLRYDENAGKGHALLHGLATAKGQFVGWLDSDLDIHPEVIVRACRRLLAAPSVDAIVGSKRHPESVVSYPLVRRVYSRGFQLLIRCLFRVNVPDTQVGAKVFRREMIDTVAPLLLVKRYAFDLEVLAVAADFGFDRVEQVPIALEYRFSGTSISWRAVYRMLLDTLAIAYRVHVLHYYVRQYASVRRQSLESTDRRDPIAAP